MDRIKVAIASEGDKVCIHFGRCAYFTIIEIQDDKIVDKKTLLNPGHRPGYLPQLLHEYDVQYVITGGAGKKALQLFEELGIRVILGIEGKVDDVIQDFIKGKLQSKASLCRPGEGKNLEEKEKIPSNTDFPSLQNAKVCVTSKEDSLNSEIDPRFGRCNYFIILQMNPLQYEVIKNPNVDLESGAGIKSAQLVVDKKVDAIFTGSVGPHAKKILKQANIKVFTGVKGEIQEIIDKIRQV